MKILLVATNRMMTPFPVYPIGVDYVATALRDHHEVRVMDLACDDADATLTASLERMSAMVTERAKGRRHWVTGSGSAEMAQVLKRMYQRGRTGPLWDRLVA
jgi:hypothetical protein